jgi:arylsulfatase A
MDFFQGTGGLRMHKGYVYEGGIRIPLIGRWPGRIAAGGINNHVCAFQDLLPTFLDTAGAAGRIPSGIDGISFWPTLSGRGTQHSHSHLYMEFPAYGGQQMVRMGNWKGLRQNLAKNPAAPVELYDLEKDRAEKNDVAAAHSDVVRKIGGIMKAEHRPSAAFPFPALDKA